MMVSEPTPAQYRLLLAMHHAGPRRVHSVHALGARQPVLRGLVQKGFAVFSRSWQSDAQWKGKLTPKGCRLAKQRLAIARGKEHD